MKYLLASFLVLAVCAPAIAEDYPTRVSMLQLITSPERFHNKKVRVIGFFRCEFEGTVLYPHREDYEHSLIPNGIAMNIDEFEDPTCKALDLSYVIAEGVFSSKGKGHMSLWSGTLTKISRFEKWNPGK